MLGRWYLLRAGLYAQERDAMQARQAYANVRWNYLQVLIRYSERKEYQEEAMYFVGLCYDRLKDQEPRARDLAIRYWLELVRSFPDGTFAKQAAKDLKRIGYKGPE